jgi:hypothetical protein
MLRLRLVKASLVGAVVTFTASGAYAQEFSAKLNGFNELGALNNQTGAVLSNGTGTVKLDLDQKGQTVAYTLTYSNVGTTPPQLGIVSQAHIHFGKSRDSGGVMVFFCTNLGNGPAGTPACPTTGGIGTVTSTWTPASVVKIAGQNVNAGDFNALVGALLSNTAYANVHTVPAPGAPATDTAFPAGEIRGQIHADDEDHDHDKNQGHNH